MSEQVQLLKSFTYSYELRPPVRWSSYFFALRLFCFHTFTL